MPLNFPIRNFRLELFNKPYSCTFLKTMLIKMPVDEQNTCTYFINLGLRIRVEEQNGDHAPHFFCHCEGCQGFYENLFQESQFKEEIQELVKLFLDTHLELQNKPQESLLGRIFKGFRGVFGLNVEEANLGEVLDGVENERDDDEANLALGDTMVNVPKVLLMAIVGALLVESIAAFENGDQSQNYLLTIFILKMELLQLRGSASFGGVAENIDHSMNFLWMAAAYVAIMAVATSILDD